MISIFAQNPPLVFKDEVAMLLSSSTEKFLLRMPRIDTSGMSFTVFVVVLDWKWRHRKCKYENQISRAAVT